MARKLIVEIVGDDSSLRKALARSSRETKEFQATVTKTGRSLSGVFAAGFAGVGAGAVFTQAINTASDLNEQMSKTQQVFGDSAAEIKAWSQTTATALGISERQALGTASSFGALFQPMGLIGPKAAQQSIQLTQLGADLASFYNTDVQDALDALRSGIVGESEPLRRYGVLLSETRVQAAALAQTHKKSATDLTAAEKALARITLIMHDTSKAQGDFARTSEGLANQTRKLRAEWDDFSTHIGETYIPMLTGLTKAVNEAFEAFAGTALDRAAAPAGLKTQAALVPELALMYDRLRERGLSASEAIAVLTRRLGDSEKAAYLIGDAINYSAGGPMREKITKLRQEVYGLGTDAETSAKQMHGLAAATAEVAAAAPRGMAALSPAARAGLQLAQAGLTVGTADNLAALRRQHELDQRAAQFARNRLSQATGPAAARWAENLRTVLERDASTLDQIRGIQADNARKAEDARQKTRDAAKATRDALIESIRAEKERRLGWLEFAAERAENTKTLKDDRKAWRAIEKYWLDRIRHEGRTLESVREVYRARQKLRDLNKQNADQDPLAGLMQVSSKRLANILAAGTGLGIGGIRRLEANIAGAEIQPLHIHVNLDGREVAVVVTKHQARSGYRTARQTSGFRG